MNKHDNRPPDSDDGPRTRLEELAHTMRNKLYAIEMGLSLLQRQGDLDESTASLYAMIVSEHEQAKQTLEALVDEATRPRD